jgi:hypothetical protein
MAGRSSEYTALNCTTPKWLERLWKKTGMANQR